MLKINQILRKNNFPELKPQMNNDDCFIIKWPTVLARKQGLPNTLPGITTKKNFHTARTNHILSELSTCFWNINGREGIKEVLNKCYRCKQERSRLIDRWLKWPFCTFAKAGGDFTSPFTTIQQTERAKKQASAPCVSSLTYLLQLLSRKSIHHTWTFIHECTLSHGKQTRTSQGFLLHNGLNFNMRGWGCSSHRVTRNLL